MPPLPPRLPPRHTAPRSWQPLSDEEWAALAPFVARPADAPGRPPIDTRRTLDAIFWVACSRGPWRDLPPELGRPDTAHRRLRRWARAGILDHLLTTLAGPLAPDPLRRLEYWVCRAWRRMARLASLHSLVLARRLGFFTALPCAPWHIHDPDLSETLFSLSLDLIREAVADPHGFDLARLRLCGDLIGFAGGRPDKFRLK